MFVLSVVFGSASIGFMFKTQEKADTARASLFGTFTNEGFVTLPAGSIPSTTNLPLGNISAFNSQPVFIQITDDFGQHATFNIASIHGAIVEDLEQSKLARAEQMLHQARCQNVAQKLALADPGLRMMNSPAVLNPMGNGMMR